MSFPRRAVSYLRSCDSVTDTAPWQIDTSSGLLASQEGIGIPNCVKQLQESTPTDLYRSIKSFISDHPVSTLSVFEYLPGAMQDKDARGVYGVSLKVSSFG